MTTTVDLDDVAEYVTQYIEITERINDLKETQSKLRSVVNAKLARADEGALAGRVVLRKTTYQRTALDTKRLKSERPDIAEAFTTVTEATRVSIVGGE